MERTNGFHHIEEDHLSHDPKDPNTNRDGTDLTNVQPKTSDSDQVFAGGGDGTFDESDDPEDRVRRGE
ncbi:MAG: hypothetical protein KBD06_00330 [Candidatus Pacebacteria bacterium]|nr:hypothetical protein [Candidatus Paceibacterota bacterium]